MAIIDYNSIHSGAYAKLSLSAKALIPVLSTLCDDWSGALSPEDSKHARLAALSGLSVKSVKRALPALAATDIISIVTQSGKPASIQYLPQVRFSKQGGVNSTPRSQSPTTQVTESYQVGHYDLPPIDDNQPQTPTVTAQNKNGKNVALNNRSNNGLKQQQPASASQNGTSAASKVRESLIKHMRKEHGYRLVNDILDAMKFLNGEVENPNAFFNYFCSRGIVPTYKSIQERKKAIEAAQRRQDAQAEAQRSFNAKVEEFKRERADREAQARVKKHQEEIAAILAD